jgi:hypothetical protein
MPVTEKDASFELMAMLRSRWFLAPYADDGWWLPLQILYQLLQNVELHDQAAQSFYQTYFTDILQHIFSVVTDTSHTAGKGNILKIVSSGMWFTYPGFPSYIQTAFSTLDFFLLPEDGSSLSTGQHGTIPEDNCHHFCCENLSLLYLLSWNSSVSIALGYRLGLDSQQGQEVFSSP